MVRVPNVLSMILTFTALGLLPDSLRAQGKLAVPDNVIFARDIEYATPMGSTSNSTSLGQDGQGSDAGHHLHSWGWLSRG